MCVEQSAAELCALGIQVHVVADATTSRTQEDRLLAFQVQFQYLFSFLLFFFSKTFQFFFQTRPLKRMDGAQN